MPDIEKVKSFFWITKDSITGNFNVSIRDDEEEYRDDTDLSIMITIRPSDSYIVPSSINKDQRLRHRRYMDKDYFDKDELVSDPDRDADFGIPPQPLEEPNAIQNFLDNISLLRPDDLSVPNHDED